MPSLRKDLRSQLEKAIVAARREAVAGAREALEALAVGEAKPFAHLSKDDQQLRINLRAHGRSLGDQRDKISGRQTFDHLTQAVAYEQWHRMLFARFLAENGCLLEPSSRVAVSLADLDELAREERTQLWALAGRFASQMLPQIFRPDDPALAVNLAPEARQALEKLLSALPAEVFLADDSLGWVYQFWQTEAKDAANDAGEKIGADTLSAVTQLFTEDYMVDWMLHNTLGAWHAGKKIASGPITGDNEEQLRAAVALPDLSWNYLRWTKSESGPWIPAAGIFPSWPRKAAELTLLDPCMGSGHFLVASLPVLARLRMAEENLSPAAAARAVLRDNIHGLELDPRCAQLAGFNLALAAWKFAPDLLHEPEPLTLHLACCGLQLQGTEAEWQAIAQQAAKRSGLGGGDQLFADKGSLDGALEDRVVIGMRALHDLFRQAPVLGSLIDPRNAVGGLGDQANALAGDMGLFVNWDDLAPVLHQALAGENSGDAESHELAVQVQGLAKAADLLAGRYTFVVTNVPYLARGKQDEPLKEHCERVYPEAKSDLATCFVERCLAFCGKGGSTALVTPQNWLFLGSYKHLRQRLLREITWDSVVRLGEHGFDSAAAAGAFTALLTLTRQVPKGSHSLAGLDASAEKTPTEKSPALANTSVITVSQKGQLGNPDGAVSFEKGSSLPLLSKFVKSMQGTTTGDNPQFIVGFWELPIAQTAWEFFQSTVDVEIEFGGRSELLKWENGNGQLAQRDDARVQGFDVFGKRGVFVGQMRELPTTLFSGEFFNMNGAAVVPHDPAHLPAIWCFCSSAEYNKAVRAIDQALKVTNASLVKVPFDLARWQRVAAEKYPNGLPKPHSDDPTQWLFNGHPKGSEQPLHVALARLLGYRWPRQTGSSFPDCPALAPDSLENYADHDGIVCLSALRGERTASDRLHSLLSAALGTYDEQALLAAAGGKARTLEDWLRDEAFEQHCKLFHHRPFIWHIWDGRADGFHVFVNYHQLAAPNGAGRKLLETLLYSYLGDWIRRQQDDTKRGEPGAEDRLIAAQALQKELEAILSGGPPYDLFIRWKPLHQQPIGWEPDLNDGVRLNIRPFLSAKDVGRKGAGVLRFKPNVKWDKDRGKEPARPKADFPWFWKWDEATTDFPGGPEFDGNRWNDCHYTPATKRAARKAHKPTK